MSKFSKWTNLEDEPSFEKILRQKPHREFEEREGRQVKKKKSKKRRAAKREHD